MKKSFFGKPKASRRSPRLSALAEVDEDVDAIPADDWKDAKKGGKPVKRERESDSEPGDIPQNGEVIKSREQLDALAGREVELPDPSSDRSYSNSEPEEDKLIPGIFNKTKKNRKADEERVDNYLRWGGPIPHLHQDAQEIHDVIPRKVQTGAKVGKSNQSYGATTVVTALLLDTESGRIKKFVFSNLSSMGNELTKRAEGLGYHVITAGVSHAEGELIQFLHVRNGLYKLLSIGCDKPHCAECREMLNRVIKSWHTQSLLDPEDAKLFPNYYLPWVLRLAADGIKQTEASKRKKLPVDRHINENKKARAIDQYEKPSGYDADTDQ